MSNIIIDRNCIRTKLYFNTPNNFWNKKRRVHELNMNMSPQNRETENTIDSNQIGRSVLNVDLSKNVKDAENIPRYFTRKPKQMTMIEFWIS